MVDNFRHKGLRQQLVQEVYDKGIRDKKVLEAIAEIPRHLFMDKAFLEFAYQDKAFPIGCGQTISQPYTVAFQTELLQLKPHEKVLEVGTGSGYQAAVLIKLKAQVFTIERQKDLYAKTKDFLPKIGYPAMFVYGDGYKGLSKMAPFDKIIVTCGAPYIPQDLLSQLKVGGRLVIPVGEGEVQQMTLIVRTSEKDFEKTVFGDFSFVPMLPKKSR
ncbi:MAG: protein-L-isoaspartate(D-aspartate) O-methyltransferase [Bacteroidetes bacterium]|nr:protein-L-isoaspartate(D-aspartate) O-methyltransferase [Bacteroidota bacterium]